MSKPRRRRRKRDPAELLADPATARAVLEAMRQGEPGGFSAFAWAAGWSRSGGGALEGVVERYKRAAASPSVTVAAIQVGVRAEVRASMVWRGERPVAHLRTWYEGRNGAWCPTKRGVTFAPEQLEQLEAAVRALREAYAARALPAAGGPAERDPQEGEPGTPPTA